MILNFVFFRFDAHVKLFSLICYSVFLHEDSGQFKIARNHVIFYKFSPNLLNGLICEVRAHAKQSLLRRS